MKAFATTIAAALAMLTSHASAAVYTFTIGTGSGIQGGAGAFPIYLNEGPGGSATTLAANGGLYSFGLVITVTNGPGTIANVIRNPAFDQNVTTGPNASTTVFPTTSAKAYAQQDANFDNGVLPDANGNALLATVVLNNVSAATTFTVADINTGAQTVDYAFNTLDPTNVATRVVGVVVPEPTTLAAIGAGLVAMRRRRRQ